MSHAATSPFIDGIRALKLLDDEQLAELEARPEAVWGDVLSLSKYAQERGWLTAYQAQELSEGRGSKLALGGYRLFDLVADNEQGRRFKAVHPAVAQPVDVRLVRHAWLGTADTATDYLARAQANGLAHHPHLASVLDAGEHDGSIFVVQELVDGCDLFQLVNEMGALPVGLASEYVRQAALAVQAAHAANLVHGDVSPLTMLLTPVKRSTSATGEVSIRPRSDAKVKLVDMGLTPIRPALEQLRYDESDQLGRLSFLPPDHVTSGDRHAAADVYGLGASLYFLLTTRPPTPGTTQLETITNLRQGEPVPLASLRVDVPPALADLVERMIARDPQARPTLDQVIGGLFPHCEPSVMATPVPGNVLAASETFTLPGVPTAVPVARNLDAPAAEVEPFAEEIPPSHDQPLVEPLPDDHHDDGHEQAFEHSAMGANTPRAARPKTKANSKNMMWIVVGLCLHLTATTLCLGFGYPGWFNSKPSEPTEQKEEKKNVPTKTKKRG